MREIPMKLAFLLLGVSAFFFIVQSSTSTDDIVPGPFVPPVSAIIVLYGLLGGGILVGKIYYRINDNLNRPPQPPYFVIHKTHSSSIKISADGSYENCLRLLFALETHFGAKYFVQLETGLYRDRDNCKGFWNVEMFGQDFHVDRHPGLGLCIIGPIPRADLCGFLQIATHFGAVEFLTWQEKLVRKLQRTLRKLHKHQLVGLVTAE